GCSAGLVEKLDIPQQKYPLPRHEHVVEKDHTIHIVEPRAERVVEGRAALVETVSAEEPQPLGAARNGEIEGERIVSGRVKRNTRRIDRDLLSEGAERGEHPGAAHDDSFIRLADAVQGGSLLEIV